MAQPQHDRGHEDESDAMHMDLGADFGDDNKSGPAGGRSGTDLMDIDTVEPQVRCAAVLLSQTPIRTYSRHCLSCVDRVARGPPRGR